MPPLLIRNRELERKELPVKTFSKEREPECSPTLLGALSHWLKRMEIVA